MLRLLKKHVPVLNGCRIGVLGLAFKAGTDDIRESPALRVIRDLHAEGARVVAYDPVAIPSARLVLGDTRIEYAASMGEALRDVEAVVLMTAWPEFQDVPRLLLRLAHPPVVVDGRRALDRRRRLGTRGSVCIARSVLPGSPSRNNCVRFPLAYLGIGSHAHEQHGVPRLR